jgi:hypothetical protein
MVIRSEEEIDEKIIYLEEQIKERKMLIDKATFLNDKFLLKEEMEHYVNYLMMLKWIKKELSELILTI